MSAPVKQAHKSGFVSILGRPNAGKSTLLNRLVGMKLAIVAPRPQTTRTSIQGVLHLKHAQIVLVDTPGIHKPDTLLNRRMLETVKAALDQRDLLVYVTDATRRPEAEDEEALQLVREARTPAFLLLNKIDALTDKRLLLERIETFRGWHAFEEYLPVSARTGDGIEDLIARIVERLPEGPAYFPEDYVTDQPERFLAAELVREQILRLTRQEVPHAAAVVVDQWEEKGALTRIAATIYVERESQKAIVIGAKGAMLKQVGTAARQQIEAVLGRRVFLELFVKAREKWRENPEFLNAVDWRSVAGPEAG
jgi:GTP-binding protein Era